MKRNLLRFILVSILCLIPLSMTGCFLFEKSDAVNVVSLSQGDSQALKTIGKDFVEYFGQDTSIDPETANDHRMVMRNWETLGSDWSTFDYLVGNDGNGFYVSYVENDKDLEQSDRTARFLNIESWKINIEKRNGGRQ